MIISKTVMARWNGKIITHYLDKGYKNPGYNNLFEIKIEDLSPGSGLKVEVACDKCGSIRSVPYNRVSNLCNKCTAIEGIIKAQEKTKELMKEPEFLQQMKDRMAYAASKIDKEKRTERFKELNNKQKNDPEYIRAFTERSKTQIRTPGYREKLIEGKRKFDSDPERKEKSREKRKENRLIKFAKIIHEKGLNITPEEMELNRQNKRNDQKVKTWRYAIYKKFNFTCQFCFKTANKKSKTSLNAHHIESWSANIESRYEINNGACLCSKCHIQFHSEYGKITNSENFFEWISCNFMTNITSLEQLFEFNKNVK